MVAELQVQLDQRVLPHERRHGWRDVHTPENRRRGDGQQAARLGLGIQQRGLGVHHFRHDELRARQKLRARIGEQQAA
ncbi:hypothetical protein D3C71_1638120 [compost metagenome]